MITIDVRKISVVPVEAELELNHVVYRVVVLDDHGEWVEEWADHERVCAFIRGVKAGAAASRTHTVHVNQPEWNV
jgi:head-tail adaptor